ncbi:MAG: S8 family serine peptidase [Actinomycetota bacterium]
MDPMDEAVQDKWWRRMPVALAAVVLILSTMATPARADDDDDDDDRRSSWNSCWWCDSDSGSSWWTRRSSTSTTTAPVTPAADPVASAPAADPTPTTQATTTEPAPPAQPTEATTGQQSTTAESTTAESTTAESTATVPAPAAETVPTTEAAPTAESAPAPAEPPSATANAPSSFLSGTSDAASRPGSLYRVVDQIGARQLWAQGITGAGVDVAVIDTGIAPVPALAGPDKVAAVVDLSFEAGIPEARYLDTNGHGTHMAGIIAGSDPGGDPSTAHQRPDEFQGVAPGARIVSVKVGDNTGAVDVSQVIAAIDWVIEHRTEGGLNIRVINLSYGTDSLQPYEESPLSYAVQRAWDAGIVVVVAAGNDGWSEGRLAAPANDPYVIAVGAAEWSTSQWFEGFGIPEWASAGAFLTSVGSEWWQVVGPWSDAYTSRHPDVVAPGASIESLRVPGSRVAAEQPQARVNEWTMKGSGTSQAAAVVSGAVALLLDGRPDLTPDEVKAILGQSADRLSWAATAQQGDGMIDLPTAMATPTPNTTQAHPRSNGRGSLDKARGNQRVTLDGAVLTGERTAFGDSWNTETWLDLAALNDTWSAATTVVSDLTGSSWTGSSWTGSSWTGSSWTGSSWTGSSWTGSSWTGSSWTGSSWTGSSWTGSSWSGSSWSGSSWNGSSWSGSSWSGSSWSDYGWKGVSWH